MRSLLFVDATTVHGRPSESPCRASALTTRLFRISSLLQNMYIHLGLDRLDSGYHGNTNT